MKQKKIVTQHPNLNISKQVFRYREQRKLHLQSETKKLNRNNQGKNELKSGKEKKEKIILEMMPQL